MFVAGAEGIGQIALLVPDADEDVDGHADREEEVTDGHEGSGPEGYEESEVERMANEFVKERRAESQLPLLFVREVLICLVESKKMEMIYQEGAHESDGPAEERDREDDACGGSGDGPDGNGKRLPKQKEQHQCGAGEQDVGAAFDGGGDVPGPFFFKSLAGHDAVLKAEEGDEQQIDQDAEGGREASGYAYVKGFRNGEVGDETDEIKEGDEEDEVCDKRIDDK